MRKLLALFIAATIAIVACATSYVEVTGTNARLRLEPNLSGAIYKDSKGAPIYPAKGEKLECLGESGDFYKVSFKGKQLYISKQFSRVAQPAAKGDFKKPAAAEKVKTSPLPEGKPTKADRKQAPKATSKATPKAVVVTGKDVRLRATAPLKGAIIKDAKGNNLHPDKGQRLVCTGESGDFYKVVFNGITAYISKQYTQPVE